MPYRFHRFCHFAGSDDTVAGIIVASHKQKTKNKKQTKKESNI
jgi:hypothetical protein